jgi:hemerythrin-like domain-containing protein
MDIMRVLMAEHRTIMTSLELLDRVGLSALAGSTSAVQELAGLLAFLRDFLEQGHYRREEAVLFPLMEQCGMAWEGGPLEMLSAEHAEGRSRIQVLRNLHADLQRGEEGAADRIYLEIRSYRRHMEAHIHKEDRVLFPMLQRLLPRVGTPGKAGS